MPARCRTPVPLRRCGLTRVNGETYFDLSPRVPYNSRDRIVKILMIAPEPFFEPRGTPFSEYHRIRALLELGHTVDLVTYPFGRDVSLPGLRVFRCLRPPFVHEVRIGPSLAKIPLDLTLTVTALRRALADRYDAVHSHEEGSFIGVLIAGMLGVPHLYDMHSSLPQQLTNFAFSQSRALTRAFSWMERFVVRRSRVVVVICPHLEEVVRGIEPGVPAVLIENAPGSGDTPIAGSGARIRAELGLAADAPVILYTGTFEAYQGLDLLFGAARQVIERRPDARFVLAGGRPDQIAAARAQAERAGLGESVVFAGQRPFEEIPLFLDAADVLVSPRSTGTNTPLKIYQYLRAGRPIVATRLLTHTQVLNDDVAILTAATPEGFAAGILVALTDPQRARAVGDGARLLADTKYSYEAYLTRTREACAHLMGKSTAQVAGGVA
jgi:glycosyltransferase involved in cell wall biosynthesis